MKQKRKKGILTKVVANCHWIKVIFIHTNKVCDLLRRIVDKLVLDQKVNRFLERIFFVVDENGLLEKLLRVLVIPALAFDRFRCGIVLVLFPTHSTNIFIT